MSKKNSRKKMSEEDFKNFITGVAEEIKNHDLDEKSGAGTTTAIEMTMAGKCGNFFTISYECSDPHVSCGG
jgi:hypothetical protein